MSVAFFIIAFVAEYCWILCVWAGTLGHAHDTSYFGDALLCMLLCLFLVFSLTEMAYTHGHSLFVVVCSWCHVVPTFLYCIIDFNSALKKYLFLLQPCQLIRKNTHTIQTKHLYIGPKLLALLLGANTLFAGGTCICQARAH